MTRTHRRLSRALVALVGITFALGLVFWLHNLTKGKAAATDFSPLASNAVTSIPLANAETPATTQSSPELLIAVTGSSTTQPTPGQSASGVPDSPKNPGAIISEATTLFDKGKFLEPRKLLNDALQSGALTGDDLKSAKQLLNQINSTVVFSARKFPDDPSGGTFTVPPGGVLEKIAKSHDVSPQLLMRINGISDPRRLQAGQNLKIISGPFNALVNKTDFTIEVWMGEPGGKQSMYITSFPVGLGKDDSTPTGTWAVSNKLKDPTYYSPRGGGIIAAGDPKNPLGEYWIGLTGTDGHAVGKSSYGIHGTIDPSSIGKQESMGCIRLRNEDVAQVYEMLVAGKSTVTVTE